MQLKRTLPLALGLGMLFATGCTNRDNNVELDELRADNGRMAHELDALYKENALMKVQRDRAREELAIQKAQTDGLAKQLENFGSNPTLLGEGWESDDGGLSLPNDFAFGKGSDALKAAGKEAIAKLANLLNSKDYAGTKVFVIGHSDNTPVVRASTKAKFTDNWGLSALRAAAVVRELEKAGVSASRILGNFRGEHDPRADNKSKAGQAKNRRVNIQVSL